MKQNQRSGIQFNCNALIKPFSFQSAIPVWETGRETEMNCELAFRTIISGKEVSALSITASSIYRIWVNGKFIAAGPARVAHGYYRVDQLNLTPHLTADQNILVIEVVGFNVNSYDTLDQPAFLTAEVVRTLTGEVIAATGKNILCYDLKKRIQKVQRYSFQRAFAEAYRLKAEDEEFFLGKNTGMEVSLSAQPEKIYIPRKVPVPEYEELMVEKLIGRGNTVFGISENPYRDRTITMVGPKLKGFLLDELEVHLSDEAQGMQWIPDTTCDSMCFPQKLQNEYALYGFPYNATGFLKLTISCEECCTVYLLFDEILSEGDVDILRLTNCNCFRYELDAGIHHIMTFAAYTMKYLKVVCHGSCTVIKSSIVEYQHPMTIRSILISDDSVLQKISEAAIRTYRQNALDLFMDCPSRERAGWLCDSFFTARVEKVLTGKSVLEKEFLTNFLLPDRFELLPDGMLPMCYPADHYDGNFIPNWAMWFVLELDEYVYRSEDFELLQFAKNRIYSLLDYFKKFENEYGLLEKLEQWVFVEWSRANDADVVQDVNFPTNMLYARMLEIVGRRYDDKELLHKSEELRSVICQRSFNGIFFTDNECRTPDGFVNPGNTTEVCQYYAFYMGIATREKYPKLWKTLVDDFGPQRKQTLLHPDVAFANAFIGNYLRIDLLYQAGLKEEVRSNIRGYFEMMADTTGTLWEHDSTFASCNHGFASHVLYWLAE